MNSSVSDPTLLDYTEPSLLAVALNSHAIVSLTDVAGNIIYANDKFCEISGYSRAELVGQNHRLLKSGHHDHTFFRDLWRTISSGEVWQGDVLNRAKDGSEYWVQSTIVPIPNEEGLPKQYLSIRTVITEQKKDSLALEQLNAQLLAVANAADLVVIQENITDQTAKFIITSEFDQGSPAVVGMERLKSIPEAYHAALESIYQEPGVWAEIPLMLPGHSKYKWVYQSVVQLFEEHGKLYALVLAYNITNRVEREQSLKQTLLQNKELFDSNQELTQLLQVAIDKANLYLYEENLSTGEARSIYKGDDPFDEPLVGDQLLARIPDEYHDTFKKSEVEVGLSVEFPIRLDQFNVKWVRHSVIKEFERDNQLYRYAMSMDISDLVEQREHLVNLLNANKLALSEKNEALSELQLANQKRNQMYGIVAHELRTPASTIHMLGVNDTDEDWLQHRDEVIAATDELLHSIDDMRMIVNPNLQRPVRLEIFNVSKLAKSLDRAVASTVASTGLQFRAELIADEDSLDVALRADLYRIKVSVTNLVRNACLHSQGTLVELEIRLKQISDHKYQLVFFVRDNGVGIPVEQVTTIFSPYVRGGTEAEGTGLGLHIARSWIEEIGGTLSLNQADVGCEFQIALPVEIAPTLQSEPRDESSLYDSAAPLDGMRILYAEDEMVLRMIGGKLLEQMGATVVLAKNGYEAINEFTSGFDLVVTDYFMPEMDGVALIKAIRNRDEGIPIIGVTAATLGDQIDTLLAAGANCVLGKPLTSGEFLDAALKVKSKRLL